MKVNLVKINGGLFPSLDEDAEIINKIKRGDVVQYEIKKPRNAKFHRKYFAMLQVVTDNTDYNTDQLLLMIKLRMGHFDSFITPGGKTLYKPKSISFSKMDNDEFERFYQKTMQVILNDFLRGSNEKELQNQVDKILRFL